MFDVAIIGCGPVGALAANLLGKAGLRTLVIEKEANPFPLPRAVHLDHEMMRLFQAATVIDRVKNDMRAAEGHLHIGADNGVIRYMGTVGIDQPFGWSNDYFFYQPELEDHLRQALTVYSNVDLRLGTEFQYCEQIDDLVTLHLINQQGSITETARWVIACDGAHSTVRKSIGITLDDLHFEEPWLVVDAEVEGPIHFPQLNGVPKEVDLQKISVMMCDPNRPATVVPGRGNLRRWELMLLPGEDDLAMMKKEKVAELLQPWLKGVKHNIVRASTYRFHGLVAHSWRSGNVFLAGDAAHQTPPFFGQGMCHGLRDVANLAWKIAMIMQGSASTAILDTYEEERSPHVRAVINAAVEAGRYICILDPEQAAIRDAKLREQSKNQNRHTTAADLIPPIQSGILFQNSACVGERFIQPLIKTSTRNIFLDDYVSGSWKVFTLNNEAAVEAKNVIAQKPINFDLSITDASSLPDNGVVHQWLKDNKVRAVIVRPDFYVFGTASDSIATLFDSLTQQLQSSAKESAQTNKAENIA